jgi:hypothetical protein
MICYPNAACKSQIYGPHRTRVVQSYVPLELIVGKVEVGPFWSIKNCLKVLVKLLKI